MCPKDVDRMGNSVDLIGLLFEEQSDLGLHCLPRPVCLCPDLSVRKLRTITLCEACEDECNVILQQWLIKLGSNLADSY